MQSNAPDWCFAERGRQEVGGGEKGKSRVVQVQAEQWIEKEET